MNKRREINKNSRIFIEAEGLCLKWKNRTRKDEAYIKVTHWFQLTFVHHGNLKRVRKVVSFILVVIFTIALVIA